LVPVVPHSKERWIRFWRSVKKADAAPHLSCVGGSRESIRDILQQYQANNIHRLVALRGDLPSGYGMGGEFRHASDLVEFIRAETGNWFHIEVAAYPEMHPQARSPQDDLQNFVRKMNAGANAAITQYFYNADAYFRFVEEAQKAGVTAPIVAGIMPITNSSQLLRFSEMWRRDSSLDTPETGELQHDTASIKAFGLDVVSSMCERLLVWRTRAAFLFTESGGCNHGDLATSDISKTPGKNV
jgi:methylenetetrahydrofolate reductase (NADPH)